jgi:cytochrome c5
MLKKVALVALMLVALFGVVACGNEGATSEETPVVEPTPGEATGLDGEAIVNAKCGGCHSLDQVFAYEADAVGWETVIDEMIAKGAQLTDDEKTAAAEYLANR